MSKTDTFNKITTGYVIQEYKRLPNGTTVCIGQTFTAGEGEYEDNEGNPIEPDNSQEVYCPFDMVQPKEIDGNKNVTILSHNISYYFDDDSEIELGDCESEQIEYMIGQGFSEGELNKNPDIRGYWSIKN